VNLRGRLQPRVAITAFLNLLFPLLFSALLESQVQIKVENLWIVLCEVLATSDLRILEKVEHRHRFFGQRLAQIFEELFRIA
jgi:hypothetical protein